MASADWWPVSLSNQRSISCARRLRKISTLIC